MKNLLKLLLTAPLAVLALPTLAQQEHISKLEVEKNGVYIAQATDLRIDTLILHQNASIRFAAGERSTLQVQHGFIGKDCVILSAGENGMRGKLGADGMAGTDAGSLAIDIHLEQLGSLTIDARGGNGGDGYRGKNGRKRREETSSHKVPDGKGGYTTVVNTEVIEGTAGEWGTAPGSGGNGGDLTLRYSTSGFTPNFNRKDAPHSITVLYQAGLAGKRGRDGVSYEGSLSRQSMSYQPSHNELRDGTVQLEKK